ncbi:unnamed protein product, partial [Ectocarpus sp. 13 AM-2016]
SNLYGPATALLVQLQLSPADRFSSSGGFGEFGGGSLCRQQQQQQPGEVYGGDSQHQPRQQQLANGFTEGAGGRVSGGVLVGEKGGRAAAGSSAAYLPVKAP